MDITITKGDRLDRIDVRRDDGSAVSFDFPKKGVIPHDVVHLFVESELGAMRGFWGLVASGIDPEEVGAMAKAAGHASAKRAEVPSDDFVPIIQIERLVEAFEADQWGGGSDNDAVRAMAASGCEQSLVPAIYISDDQIDAVRNKMSAFRDQWQARASGDTEQLRWELGEA